MRRFKKGDVVRLVDVIGFAQPERWRGLTFTVFRGGAHLVYLRGTHADSFLNRFGTTPERLELIQSAEDATLAQALAAMKEEP